MPDLPENEYDGYAAQVVRLLREGADDLRIASHLNELERGTMGLTPTPPQQLGRIVQAIRRAADG